MPVLFDKTHQWDYNASCVLAEANRQYLETIEKEKTV